MWGCWRSWGGRGSNDTQPIPIWQGVEAEVFLDGETRSNFGRRPPGSATAADDRCRNLPAGHPRPAGHAAADEYPFGELWRYARLALVVAAPAWGGVYLTAILF
jgi:hypothetical protein